VDELLATFTRASKLVRAAADQALRKHDLRVGQNLLLELLWERDGRTIGELADTLQVSAPTVAKMVTRMEATGFVKRRRSETDTRVVRVRLTPKGKASRDAVRQELTEIVVQLTRGMSEREQAALRRSLRKVVDAFAETVEGPLDVDG
jgi:MarR family transcriptional regulator, organic hydroperoxide resistance regulator